MATSLPSYDPRPRCRVTAGKGSSHLSHTPQGGRCKCLDFWYHYDHTQCTRGNSPKGNEGVKGNGCWATQANRYPLLQSRARGSRVRGGRKGGRGREKDPVDRRLPPFRSHLIRSRPCSVRHFTCRENWVVFFAAETVLFTEVRPHVIRAGRCLQAVTWWVLGSLPSQHYALASGHLLESHVQEPSLWL